MFACHTDHLHILKYSRHVSNVQYNKTRFTPRIVFPTNCFCTYKLSALKLCLPVLPEEFLCVVSYLCEQI